MPGTVMRVSDTGGTRTGPGGGTFGGTAVVAITSRNDRAVVGANVSRTGTAVAVVPPVTDGAMCTGVVVTSRSSA